MLFGKSMVQLRELAPFGAAAADDVVLFATNLNLAANLVLVAADEKITVDENPHVCPNFKFRTVDGWKP